MLELARANWEIWVDDPSGSRLKYVETAARVELAMAINAVGAYELQLPADFEREYLRVDGFVEFWRRGKCLDFGLGRKFGYDQDDTGVDVLTTAGYDKNELLKARLVAYAAGSSQAEKTDTADDFMKAVMRENFGSLATDTDRDWSSIGFSIAVDFGKGPAVTKAFSRRNVLEVLNDLASLAEQAGTPVYYDLVPGLNSNNAITLQFETFINQRGMDRTRSADKPTFFSPERGNLKSPSVIDDYRDERTVVYSGGQGQGDDRLVVEVEDAARAKRSQWGRREAWVDARDSADTTVITARANEELNKLRPRRRFAGTIIETEECQYGVDWELGDRVTAEYRGYQFDGMVKAVKFTLDGDGHETIEAKIEVDQDL